jgi:hypothetical protein
VNGDFDAALERFEREDHRPYQLHGQALAFHDMGESEKSAAALAELIDLVTNDDGTTNWDFGLARAYAWLGDADNAFKYLDREHGTLFGVPNNSYFRKIHGDARWQPLVDSIEQQAAQIQFNPKLPPELLARP